MNFSNGRTAYEVLGITHGPKANMDEIRKAYRAMMLLKHPDKNRANPNAGAEFIEVQEAFQMLNNPKAKQALDDYIWCITPKIILTRLTSRKCVDVCAYGGKGSRVLVYDRTGGDNQKWELEEVLPGIVRLVPCHNKDVCLSGRRRRHKVRMVKKTYDIPDWQLWRMVPVGNGCHRFQCVHNDQYLAVAENNTNNPYLIVWEYVEEFGQEWMVDYAW